ncbi:BA75_04346T0 [Komagataella pastoris]|uniref:BA75_04346T0 n=1 Tax=Komagataella pastoris TaxID=4922 RepID=A0A1B2JEH3_PICPA|nr:BA75_04346T0 [Komagataella pastoris]
MSDSTVKQSFPDDNICKLNHPKKEEKTKQVIEFDQEEFPEGGFGWLVVIAGWCMMATTYGMVNSFGVYQTYYQTTLYPDQSAFKISVIGALQPFCIYLFAIPTVTLLHHLDARVTIAIGAFIQIFGLMMMSLTNNIWQLFLTQGLLFGIGSGIVYLSGLTVVMQWFKRRRALAMGIVSSGSSLGGVYWPIAVKKLISEVDINWTNRILGFIYIPLGVIMVVFLKPRLSLKVVHQNIGVSDEKIKTQWLPFQFNVLKSWRFLLLISSFTVTNFSLFPGLFYIDLYGQRLAEKLGKSLVDPDYLISILNAMSLLGRVIPGILADMFGRMNVLIPFLILAGVTPLVLWLPSNSNQLLLSFVIIWGFASGVMVSLFPTLVPQLFGVKDSQSRLGLFLAIGGIGALFGPIICGTFIPLAVDAQGIDGFDKVAIFVGVMMLGGTILLILLRLVYSKKLNTII